MPRSRPFHLVLVRGKSLRFASMGVPPMLLHAELAILHLMMREDGVSRRPGGWLVGPEEVRLRLQKAQRQTERGRSSEAPLISVPRIPAAVLVGLLADPAGPQVILTERAAHLKDHAAEVSLPGGRVEAGDDGPAAAALREAFEEIGLAADKVALLGRLPAYETITGFRMFPFVGWIEPPVEFLLDTREVADIFQVPLSFVLDPTNHHRESIARDGKVLTYYVLPYPGRHIWGATAGILVNLAQALAPTRRSRADDNSAPDDTVIRC